MHPNQYSLKYQAFQLNPYDFSYKYPTLDHLHHIKHKIHKVAAMYNVH